MPMTPITIDVMYNLRFPVVFCGHEVTLPTPPMWRTVRCALRV
jgi:hypothetical protein